MRWVDERAVSEVSLGFEVVSPYYDLPPALADWLVFMRKDLGDAVTLHATKGQDQ